MWRLGSVRRITSYYDAEEDNHDTTHQALYGVAVTKPTPGTAATPGPEITFPTEFPGTSDTLCPDSSFDAILRTADGTSYVFR